MLNSNTGIITLSADDDVTLGGLLSANNSVLAVTVISENGGVVDGGDTLTDIEATGALAVVTIDAVLGVGSANAIDTEVFNCPSAGEAPRTSSGPG